MEQPIYHIPVMLPEVLDSLKLQPGSVIIDATCGEGGHSLEILKRIPKGELICLDRNTDILEKAKIRLAAYSNVSFHSMTFDHLSDALAQENLKAADGIIADLGISMFHLKAPGDGQSKSFGISYTDEESLDMRLDEEMEVSAETVINRYREEQIADILYQYGEERESRKIARAILRKRPIHNAKQLSDIVMGAKREKRGKIHPATRTFQALRIFVNKELEILESFIPHAVDNLSRSGRLVIISYHSLEDRIVKHTLKSEQMKGLGIVLTKKPILPSDEEIRSNRASRSAKLRVFEKRGLSDE